MYSEWRWITVWYKRTNGAKIPKKVEIEDSGTKRELKIKRVLTRRRKNVKMNYNDEKRLGNQLTVEDIGSLCFFYGSLRFLRKRRE